MWHWVVSVRVALSRLVIFTRGTVFCVRVLEQGTTECDNPMCQPQTSVTDTCVSSPRVVLRGSPAQQDEIVSVAPPRLMFPFLGVLPSSSPKLFCQARRRNWIRETGVLGLSQRAPRSSGRRGFLAAENCGERPVPTLPWFVRCVCAFQLMGQTQATFWTGPVRRQVGIGNFCYPTPVGGVSNYSPDSASHVSTCCPAKQTVLCIRLDL